jgi:hypothetical protein
MRVTLAVSVAVDSVGVDFAAAVFEVAWEDFADLVGFAEDSLAPAVLDFDHDLVIAALDTVTGSFLGVSESG